MARHLLRGRFFSPPLKFGLYLSDKGVSWSQSLATQSPVSPWESLSWNGSGPDGEKTGNGLKFNGHLADR